MPPAADRSPPSLPSSLSGRRILSRIASPFAAKSRSVAEFYVEVHDPHKQHSPGDVVTGSVKLRIAKAIRISHLVVCLHGYAQVYKTPGSPGEGFRANSGYLGTGRGKKSGEYFGNGFASLFEDELPLCGEGRLNEGSYQFEFELQFPDKDLPSSIDFERGTISYMITATLTRPTTISPTQTCDRKVYFVETIDISSYQPPKSRTITLEPLSKRSRAKHKARRLVDPTDRHSRKANSVAQSERPGISRVSSAVSTQAEGEAPLSPSPSQISFGTASSSNGPSSQLDFRRPSPGGSDGSKTDARKLPHSNKVITATVEPLVGGCLRGDSIPFKVIVNHTKPIRSLYGVIVTLYRQARVDMHPAIPLGPTEKGSEEKYEDYYPRSITGLGGLSLSGAGSSHLFRKDLAQVMLPLYVDPVTLTAEVNAKVRVPEEAFPSISSVPGSMISFKYFAEVVVDIQGKLSNQDRNLSGLVHNNPPLHMGGLIDGEPQLGATPFGSNIIDTAPIRRDKGVVTCTFEMVVGTRDSERRNGKRKAEPVAENETQETQSEQHHQAAAGAMQHDHLSDSEAYWYNGAHPHVDARWYQPYAPPEAYGHLPADMQYQQPFYELSPSAVPIPAAPDESQLSEKEQIRLAEARLLPSQPPGMEAEPSGAGQEPATAPYLPDEDSTHPRTAPGPSAPAYAGPIRSVAPALGAGGDGAGPSAPSYEQSAAEGPSHAATHASDDKDDLRRRQLGAAASAPPTDGPSDLSIAPTHEPSAPTREEATQQESDAFDSHVEAAGSSGLPQYVR